MSIRNPYENHFPISSIDKLVAEAKLNNAWINIGKIWLTPDEFPEFANKNLAFDSKFYLKFTRDEIKLKDPRPVIDQMEKHIIKTMESLVHAKMDFESRVKKYYSKR